MSAPGRPKREYLRSQHEGRPASAAPGRPKREYLRSQHEGSPASAAPRALARLVAAAFAALLFGGHAQAADGARPAAAQAFPAAEWPAIKQVIDTQLRALRAGDAAKAFSFAAPAIRKQFGTADNFLRQVRLGYGALLAARRTEFLVGAVIDGNVIQPLRLVAADDTVQVALYTLERQPDGAWKITSCVLAPSTVQSA
jgi:hypothetical protein